VFVLDPTLAQERLLRSYCGAARVAYNQVAPWWREVSPGREHVSSPSREVPQSSTSRGYDPRRKTLT